MSIANISAFDGLKPIVDPVLLPQGGAQIANNVQLVSGAIVPLQGLTTLKALTKTAPQTIYRYGSSANENEYWLEFSRISDIIRSPIIDNQYGLLYWSDGVQVKYAPNSMIVSGSTYPGASYNLGIPAPSSAPTITGTAAAEASASETRTYVYTYVSTYGEEGPPSPASNLATLDPTQPVYVDNLGSVPSGVHAISLKRIYRSSAVNGQAQLQFVVEVPVSQASYTDTVSQAALGEVLPSTDWVAPPANLLGLKLMANSIGIGFVENTVYLSEPNLVHAWPHQYPTDYKIVGVGIFGQSAVILTEGYPYIMSGVDPQAMSMEKLGLMQSCVSMESIVDTDGGVIYASPDGLVLIGPGQMDILTKLMLSRKQWQAYNPSSIRAVVHDNKYIAFYTKTNGVRGVLVFDFSGQGASMTTADINTDAAVTALFTDPRTDTLYLAKGTSIVRHNSGSALTFTWRSKTYRMPFPINIAVGQVVADAYPVTLKVYADGQLKTTKTVLDNNVFRLKGGFRAMDWEMELVGNSKITQATIASSVEEVRGV